MAVQASFDPSRSAVRAFGDRGAPTGGMNDPRRLIRIMGLAATLATAVGPPLFFLLFGIAQLQHRALDHAVVAKHYLERQDAQLGGDRLLARANAIFYATRDTDEAFAGAWLVDDGGTLLMFQGRDTNWPRLTAHAHIKSDGFVGSVHYAVSIEYLGWGVLPLIAVSAAFGLLAWTAFVRKPLAVLEETLANLYEKNERLKEQGQAIAQQSERFQAALNNMSQGLCVFDADKRIVIANTAYGDMYGLPAHLIETGQSLSSVVEARISRGIYRIEGPDAYREEMNNNIYDAGYHVHQLTDGRYIAVTRNPISGGGWVATHQDVTQEKAKDERLAFLANHDFLTRLANRAAWNERLTAAVARLDDGVTFAVMCLDLDRFKPVNDALGHAYGDKLLVAVADRLRLCVRERDVVARTGGDEFTILQFGKAQPDDAISVATRLIEALSAPFELGEHTVSIGTSVGIALAPGDGRDGVTLMRHADVALYEAKRAGRGTVRLFSEPVIVAEATQVAA